MKKLYITALGGLLALSANAEVLRVSNVPGSGAQFTTIQDALDASADGDIIIVDGSTKEYDVEISITKKVKLQGPGYWLTENDISLEGSGEVKVPNIKIEAAGAEICGLVANYVYVNNSNIVVKQCKANNIKLNIDATGSVIRSNHTYNVDGTYDYNTDTKTSNVLISNNLILNESERALRNLSDSYIVNNTFGTYGGIYYNVTNSVFEHNISAQGIKGLFETDKNTIQNNVVMDWSELDSKPTIDSEYREATAHLNSTYGAFSGEKPYVISGIPAGPVIKDVVVPTNVVKGEDIQVTITLGSK